MLPRSHLGATLLLVVGAGACESFDENDGSRLDASIDVHTMTFEASGTDTSTHEASHEHADAGAVEASMHVSDAGHVDVTVSDAHMGAMVFDAAHDATTDAQTSGDAGGCGEAGCPTEIVMQGLSQAGFLTLDLDNVFVSDPGTEEGTVYACPKTGCATPTTLGYGQATGLAVDGTMLYWSDSTVGDIVSCAVSGCEHTPSTVAPSQTHADGLGFDGTHFFWSTTNAVASCLAPACTSVDIFAPGQGVGITQIASTGTLAFWPSTLNLEVCAFAGCNGAPHELTAAASASVIVSGTTLFFVNSNAVLSCPVSPDSCVPFTIGETLAPYGLASDGEYVYWLDQEEPGVFRCRTTGCDGGVETFATSMLSSPGATVALDDQYVYWSATNQVLRQHK